MLKNNMEIQMKKGDIIIIVLLLFVGAACLFIQGKDDGEYVRITTNGETDRYPISEDRTIEQKNGKSRYNTIVIKDNEVYMENASCPAFSWRLPTAGIRSAYITKQFQKMGKASSVCRMKCI